MAQQSYRQSIAVWSLAALFCLLSLVAHLTAPSSARESEIDWQERLEYHETVPVFAARPFTNDALGLLHEHLGFPVRESFFAVQFLLLFLTGPVLYRYLVRLGFSHGYGTGGMAAFYLSLPIFMAFFAPNSTWSDTWMYLFTTAAFLFTLRRQLIPAALLMAAAIMARETSVLLLPFWVMLAAESRSRPWTRVLPYAFSAVILAVLARTLLIDVPLGDPGWEFHHRLGLLAYNFDGFARSRDTLFSLFTAFGAFWVVAPYQALRGKSEGLIGVRAIRLGTLWLLPAFTVITVVLMYARETRLFFPPFIFVIPMVLAFIREHRDAIERLRIGPWPAVNVLLLVGLIAACIAIATALLPSFEYRDWQDGNRVLFGLDLALLVLFVIIVMRRR